eukprot:COSAG05_NODE_105_length_18793_cov_115.346421_18_plen_208_part_00
MAERSQVLTGWRWECLGALTGPVLAELSEIAGASSDEKPALLARRQQRYRLHQQTQATGADATEEAELATVLAAVVESVADETAVVSVALATRRGDGARARAHALLPLFRLIRLALPWYVLRHQDGASETAASVPTAQQKHGRWWRLIEPVWAAFTEVSKVSTRFLVAATELLLVPALWVRPVSDGWHADELEGSGMHALLSVLPQT